MRGHMRKRSKGSWEIVADGERDPATGRRVRVYATVRGGRRDAQRRLSELIVSLDKGLGGKSSRMTLGDLLNQWHAGYVVTNCSENTVIRYGSLIRHQLVPRLGRIPLAKLRPDQIQACYSQLRAEGRVDGEGGLSERTIHHTHRALFSALKYAVRQGLVVRNVAEFVDPPRLRPRTMRTLDVDELAELLRVARRWEWFPMTLTAVSIGVRQGELLALRWKDIDLGMLTVSVTRSLYRRNGQYYFKEPKTKHSRRTLDMTPSLASFLREYWTERAAHFDMLGYTLSGDDLVFSRYDGSPIDASSLTHGFARIVREAGLPHTRFHDLRHTFASMMLLAGVNMKVISDMMGHSSVAFTMDTYGHIIGGQQRAAMKKMDEVLWSGFTPEEKNGGKMAANDPESGVNDGASERSRTSDLRFTKPLLCQLSYAGTATIIADGGSR